MRRIWMSGALALAAASGLGCGEDAPEPAATAAWTAPEPVEEPAQNHPPLIEGLRILPQDPAAGERVRASARASDADGEPVTLSFAWTVDGRALPEQSAEIQLGDLAPRTRIEVRAVARDAHGESEPATAWVDTRNRRPVITKLWVEPSGEVGLGESVLASAEGRDPDGDSLEFRYEWSVGGRVLEENGDTLSTRGLKRGDEIRVSAIASDGWDDSDAIESAAIRIANAPPRILSTPSAVSGDGSFRYVIEAKDPDGDRRLRYSLLSGPEGMRVGAISGEVTWLASAATAGAHAVEILVEDSDGGRVVQAFELTVTVADADAPPPPAAPEG